VYKDMAYTGYARKTSCLSQISVSRCAQMQALRVRTNSAMNIKGTKMDESQNSLSIETQRPWGRGLHYACLRFLRAVLWRQGAASNDLVDSLAAELTSAAEEHAEWALEHRGDWEIVARGIDYMASIHDGPWQGAAWFRNTLQVLIQLAVPNVGLDEAAAAFLNDIQQGVAESYQSAPVAKSHLRVTDEVAEMVKTLTNAGCEYGLVSDILDLNEAIFHGEPMSESDRLFLLAAATAAPFVRRERKDRKIDTDEK